MAVYHGRADLSRHSAVRFFRHRVPINLTGAVIVASVMSTQFLAQPFIWKYFANDEIFAGWILIFRDRLFVAIGIAFALSAAEAFAWRKSNPSLLIAFAAIVCGAFVSEMLLIEIDPQGDRNELPAVIGRTIRWAIAAGAGCAILYLWRQSESIAALNHETEIGRVKAERLFARLRMDALQRQIEPHFLFNTFATIRRLQRSQPEKGRMLLSRFIEFLRGSLDRRSGISTLLGDEILIGSAYLDVCSIRMGGLLRWSIDVPTALHDVDFPRYGLATLLENAIKHGIAPSPDGGVIAVSGRVEGGLLGVTVSDTGVGFSMDHGAGQGLANIREQLALRYGSSASLSLTANRPNGVRATIRLPVGQLE
ncbi:sensor histidine kinase [Novosphingobium pentaromativorans]|uniref:sensor histidine kinase n=1 Tax=Novosphingobium pentaromativorans TaxID=205844 RepID=UPI00069D8CDB|nr:histidine kinase [Novosphingobium pentaromativorans]